MLVLYLLLKQTYCISGHSPLTCGHLQCCISTIEQSGRWGSKEDPQKVLSPGYSIKC